MTREEFRGNVSGKCPGQMSRGNPQEEMPKAFPVRMTKKKCPGNVQGVSTGKCPGNVQWEWLESPGNVHEEWPGRNVQGNVREKCPIRRQLSLSRPIRKSAGDNKASRNCVAVMPLQRAVVRCLVGLRLWTNHAAAHEPRSHQADSTTSWTAHPLSPLRTHWADWTTATQHLA